MAEEHKVDESKLEPHVVRLAKLMDMSMESILPPAEAEKKEEPDPSKPPEETQEQKEAREKLEREAAEKKLADEKAAADQAAASAAKVNPDPVRPVVLVRKEEKKQPDKGEDEDEKYIASLEEPLRDEVELARFAESKGRKGYVKKLLDFYRACDKYAEEHPDHDPHGEDFTKFREEHEPKIPDHERRKLEREMVVEISTKRAREEVTKEFEPVVLELNNLRSAPVVDGAIKATKEAFSSKSSDADLVIDKEVMDKITSMPYDQAVAEYSIEAPVVVGTINAVKEWNKIMSGAVDVDESNQIHNWLLNFVAANEAQILRGPKENQIVNGRQFVTLAQMAKIQREDPKSVGRFWTLSQSDVTKRISESGIKTYRDRIQKLEKEGFVRKQPEKKTATSEVQKQEQQQQAQPQSGSPRATGHTMIGAGAEATKIKKEDLPPHLVGVAKAMGMSD